MRDPAPSRASPRSPRAAGFPILAEPTSQLRFGPHERSLVIGAYEPIARARPDRLAPDLVLRFGEMPTCKPLRQWLADLPDAAQLVVDPRDGWNEPTRIAGAIVRAEPGAAGRGARGERWPSRRPSDGLGRRLARRGGRRARRRSPPSSTRLSAADRARAAPRARRVLADGDLVYTASSMPIRDQEAFLPGGDADVLFLANRGANGIDGLISSGIGAAAATGRPAWIVTGDLGLFHDMNALAALAPRRRSRCGSSSSTTTAAGSSSSCPRRARSSASEFEAMLGTPLGLEPERVAALHGIDFDRLDDLGDLAGAGAHTS